MAKASDLSPKDWWRRADIRFAVFSPDWSPTLAFLQRHARGIADPHSRLLKWDTLRRSYSYAAPGGLYFDGIVVFRHFGKDLTSPPVVTVDSDQGAQQLQSKDDRNTAKAHFFPLAWDGRRFALDVGGLARGTSFVVAFVVDDLLEEVPKLGRLDVSTLDTTHPVYDSVLSVCAIHSFSMRTLLHSMELMFGSDRPIDASAEIGCGHAVLSTIIAGLSRRHVGLDLVDDGHVYVGYPAFDELLSRYLGIRVGRHENFEYCRHDAKTFTFQKDSLDLVVSQSCFEHIADPRDAFIRIAEGLKPGGIAVLNIDQNYSLIDNHRRDPSNEKRAWWHLRCAPEKIEESYRTFYSPERAAQAIRFYKTCNMLTYCDYMSIAKDVEALFPTVQAGILPLWVSGPYQWLARDLLRKRLEGTFFDREHYGVEDLLNQAFVFYMQKRQANERAHGPVVCPRCGQATRARRVMVTCEHCGAELARLSGGEIKAKPLDVAASFIQFGELARKQSVVRRPKSPEFDVALFVKDSLEKTVMSSPCALGQRLQEVAGSRVLVVENALDMASLGCNLRWDWREQDSFLVAKSAWPT